MAEFERGSLTRKLTSQLKLLTTSSTKWQLVRLSNWKIFFLFLSPGGTWAADREWRPVQRHAAVFAQLRSQARRTADESTGVTSVQIPATTGSRCCCCNDDDEGDDVDDETADVVEQHRGGWDRWRRQGPWKRWITCISWSSINAHPSRVTPHPTPPCPTGLKDSSRKRFKEFSRNP